MYPGKGECLGEGEEGPSCALLSVERVGVCACDTTVAGASSCILTAYLCVPHTNTCVGNLLDFEVFLCYRQSSEADCPCSAVTALSTTLISFRQWDFDLKKLPNIKMRKLCANDAIPKKRKPKAMLNIEIDLGGLELTGEIGDSKDGKLESASEASDSDEEMTPVPACP